MWTTLLRYVLRLNAATSLVGGLIAALDAGWVSETLGIGNVAITRIVGIGLIVFAADVLFVSTRPAPKLLAETRLVSAADASWVVATIIVLAAGVLSTTGVVTAAVLGLAVADFGVTQLWMRSKARAEVAASDSMEHVAFAA